MNFFYSLDAILYLIAGVILSSLLFINQKERKGSLYYKPIVQIGIYINLILGTLLNIAYLVILFMAFPWYIAFILIILRTTIDSIANAFFGLGSYILAFLGIYFVNIIIWAFLFIRLFGGTAAIEYPIHFEIKPVIVAIIGVVFMFYLVNHLILPIVLAINLKKIEKRNFKNSDFFIDNRDNTFDNKKDENYAEVEKMLLGHSNRTIVFSFFKSASENLKQGKLEKYFYDSANLCKFYIEQEKELDEFDLNFLKILQGDLSKFEKETITNDADIAWASAFFLYEIERVRLYCEKTNKQKHLDVVNEILKESFKKYGEKEVLEAIKHVAKLADENRIKKMGEQLETSEDMENEEPEEADEEPPEFWLSEEQIEESLDTETTRIISEKLKRLHAILSTEPEDGEDISTLLLSKEEIENSLDPPISRIFNKKIKILYEGLIDNKELDKSLFLLSGEEIEASLDPDINSVINEKLASIYDDFPLFRWKG